MGITSSVGLTLEQLDNISTNLDELQISLDDPSLAGGQFQLVCSKDSKINEFSGVPLDATLTTEEFEPSRGRFSVVKSVMPCHDQSRANVFDCDNGYRFSQSTDRLADV